MSTLPEHLRLPQNKDIMKGDDGYYVYWPEGNKGCYDAFILRAMADYLDEINAPWDKEVQELMEKQP